MRALFWIFFLPLLAQGLVLQEEIARDLELLGIPSPTSRPPRQEILDVAIIGGGQSGLSLCFSLYKHGVFNVQIFETSPEGLEGPWLTTARMMTLRSPKELPGPALDIPNLTFRAWYEAQWSDWNLLNKIPTSLWADYLHWYRHVLDLPVKNGWSLLSIVPEGKLLKLLFNGEREIYTKKVILATGMDGCGGFEIPNCVEQDSIPKSAWFHSGEHIDTALLHGKRISIIGAGASAFDIAATALESGAERVEVLMRRAALRSGGAFDLFAYWPSYFFLSDQERLQLFTRVEEVGSDPPAESVKRLQKWTNFQIIPETQIQCLSFNNEVTIRTDKGSLTTDLVILATGYAVNLSYIPEISSFKDEILLWSDRVEGLPPKFALFPYLGTHFEFLEKKAGAAPYLKNIHCFNYGAFFSHGFLSSSIRTLSSGAERLAEGIAIDLFLDAWRTTIPK
jgi:FAD-dependent urate hydroxylase